jgi:hypothetical protein
MSLDIFRFKIGLNVTNFFVSLTSDIFYLTPRALWWPKMTIAVLGRFL